MSESVNLNVLIMHSKHAFGLLLFPLLSISIKAQSVLFYNTENLFDTIDDTGVNDVEFLPEGTKEFGSIRYRLCIRQTSRALRLSILSTALPLELIGLCEVENRTVLDDLKNHRGFRGTGDWQIIHYDSPDRRGIDCAALLNTNVARLLYSNRIRYSTDSLVTRDALFVRYKKQDSTNVNVIIVHLPSKRGGAASSNWKRDYSLKQILMVADTCLDPSIICGDFNDNAQADIFNPLPNGWVIKPPVFESTKISGSYKYKGRWQTIDLCLTNIPALKSQIISRSTLLQKDPKWGGYKPSRRWQGQFYTNGFSDHLPVYFFNR